MCLLKLHFVATQTPSVNINSTRNTVLTDKDDTCNPILDSQEVGPMTATQHEPNEHVEKVDDEHNPEKLKHTKSLFQCNTIDILLLVAITKCSEKWTARRPTH